MSKSVTLTIDGKEVSVPEGTLLVDAAKKIGVDIPVFCYHPKMEPVGMCRMCLVEIGRPVRDRQTGELVFEEDGSPRIQFGPKLETACTATVSEGMVVLGTTEKALHGRKDIVEFLLTSHPLDCPICDKGGECPLQDLTMAHGPGQSRFLIGEKMHLAKHYPLGDLILLDRERCIQCARCVRFQDEIVDDPVLAFKQRGRRLQIITNSEPGFDSYFSGNTTDICPVGALTTQDFRFGARPWEMNYTASICPHCPVGCNLSVNIRREAKAGGQVVIKRVMPRQNEQVNEIWICDKGRFAYHYAATEERLTEPLVRVGGELQPASWDEALAAAAEGLKAAGEGALALAGGRLSNEDLFNLGRLAEGIEAETVLYSEMAGGDLAAQVGVGQGSNFADLGQGDAILVVACDLEEEAPVWWLRVKQAAERGAALIVANPRPTKSDRNASHSLRYPYGAEAATVLALVNALSAKRPDLPETARRAALKDEFQTAASVFAEAQNAVVLFGSEGTGLAASRALAQACANLLIATDHTGKPNNGLIGVWPQANTQGAWDMGFRPHENLQNALSAAPAVYAAAADPAGDDPALAQALQMAHGKGGFLVVQELFLTETALQADVVLPAQAFTEREGTYTSGERRVQRYYPAVPALDAARPDYAITAGVAALLEIELEGRVPSRIMARIAESIPDYEGITYRRLAEAPPQWPIVGGREDRYYGGTAYENSQGLGVQLMPAAQRGEAVSLAWLEPPAPAEHPQGSLLAVPVTRLYDRGRTVLPSELLHPRLAQPQVILHPDDAAGLGVAGGAPVQIALNGTQATATASLDEGIPPGAALVPRSLGIPIHEPVAVRILPVAETAGP
jgi:NADH-quinone oxidoreductase subunit G